MSSEMSSISSGNSSWITLYLTVMLHWYITCSFIPVSNATWNYPQSLFYLNWHWSYISCYMFKPHLAIFRQLFSYWNCCIALAHKSVYSMPLHIVHTKMCLLANKNSLPVPCIFSLRHPCLCPLHLFVLTSWTCVVCTSFWWHLKRFQMAVQRKLLNNKNTVLCVMYVYFVTGKTCHFIFCLLELFHSKGMD
jgi:hypothetical protein